MKILKILIICLLIFEFHGSAKTAEVIVINSNSGELNFDGVPDEFFWQSAQTFNLVMHSPNFSASPQESSTVYMTYDENYLYVAAFLDYRDPNNIIATSKKRDEKSKNPDSFGILLDTYDDNENALAFFTMPAGQRIDYAVSNDAQMMPGLMGATSQNYSWNTFWDVKTARTQKGWTVEMRIPFSSLRFQEVDGKVQMGLLINRTVSHCNEIDSYPATDPRFGILAPIKPSLAQTIELRGVKNSQPVYVSPYVSTGFEKNNELNEEETAFKYNNDKKLTGGLDVKYSLTSNLTMDLTLNTDFAQVEADDEMVNLTRYALFFPEKRMFFQERSSIFDFGLGGPSKLFYSRRIGIDEDGNTMPIYGGARLTGRIGKWDMGFMDMQTQKNDITPSENFGVLRFRRQVINANSYVGAIMTSRISPDNINYYSYGVDGIFRIFDDDYVKVNVAQTTDSLGNNFNSSADNAFFSVSWERRSEEGFAYDLSYKYAGESFDPRVGFMSRYATQGPRVTFRYGWLPGDESKLFSYNVDFSAYRSYRVSDNELETGMYGPGVSIFTKKGWFYKVDLNYNIAGVDEGFDLDKNVTVPIDTYKYYSGRLNVMSPVSKLLSAQMMFSGGEFYDGTSITVSATPILNLSGSVQLSGYYNYSHVEFPDRDQIMNAHVTRLKFLYMFNTKLSLSSFIQLNNISDFMVSNFRLRYNPKEGNDLYIVYNEIRPTSGYFDDNMENVDFLNRMFQLKYVHTFQL
ncbi:DUF5916 domain-containing protein [Prolixibacteraceae bacterium Z1-6]|uniref:DUF5916 domain-containing protein n=1 Tax=Draconibacterium aestuarii TaxID=2998507 RepID=A0A9X3F9I7_9BACT|nr:DUF5916 domain-containing protein [Prolixibacteraceae bacterium Z1-6]